MNLSNLFTTESPEKGSDPDADAPVPDSRMLALEATEAFEQRSSKDWVRTAVGMALGVLLVLSFRVGTINGQPIATYVVVLAIIALGIWQWLLSRDNGQYAVTVQTELSAEVVPRAHVEEQIELGAQQRATLLALPTAVEMANGYIDQIENGVHTHIIQITGEFRNSLNLQLNPPQPPPGAPHDTQPLPKQ